MLFIMLLCICGAKADDLTKLSFEELLSLEVTSVAKKPQRVEEASAAIFVITQDDIKKIGATSIPELFRAVPGLEVGGIDASNTAVSARGFNWRFSNKLLVLVDGRAVYQSLWSGVLWDQQLTPVEDIERIEVIRGPGATLYGANAVNGVINIVTKHAADTLGRLATLQGGVTTISEQKFGRFFARQGARIGRRGAFRLYVIGRNRPSLVDEEAEAFNGGARALQAGFRLDWEPNDFDAFTVQGDYQVLDFDVTLVGTPSFVLPTLGEQTTDEDADGFNVLGRWTRTWTRDNTLTVQAYIDNTMRSEFDLATKVNTFDFDVSHYFSWGRRFETVWGLGYRSVVDEAMSMAGGDVSFQAPNFQADLFSAFLQQDVNFFDGRLRASIGSKFEHNDFSGFEIQPSVRAIWVDPHGWSLWGAVSRAVRTPSRLETSMRGDLGLQPPDPSRGIALPVRLSILGSPDLEAEDLLAFELGFRKKWGGHTVLDITGYAHKYNGLFEVVTAPPELRLAPVGPGGALVPFEINQKLLIANGDKGEIIGFEGALQLSPTGWWALKLAGDVKKLNFPKIGALDSNLNALFLGDSPRYQVSVRSDFDITSRVNATLFAKRVGGLTQSNTDGYTDLDIRLGYRVSSHLELNVLGENLARGSRREFPSELYPAPFGFIERKVSVSAAARF